MFKKKTICFLILIALCVTFTKIAQFAQKIENTDVIKEIHRNDINLTEIESNLQNCPELNIELKLWDVEGYFNSLENTCYFLINERYADRYIKPIIKIETEEDYYYSILSESYNPDEGLCVDFNTTYDLLVYNDTNYYKMKMKFTTLPIINITAFQEITTSAQSALIEFYMEDYEDGVGTTYVNSETIIYVRGRSSLYHPKKQYRLKLRKDNDFYEVPLLGMDADEDWILDSLYSDYSKIRTKLSFDIWNQMTSYTTNDFDNSLQMKYVDVYINDEYHGLYLLKEFYDWKKLDLDKNSEEDSGILIKGIQYGDIDWNTYDTTKRTQDVFPMLMKYPKNLDDYSIYWDKILPKIYTNFFDKENITEEYLLNNFYINNYNDYNLLINFIFAADNFEEKNVYLSMKNMQDDTKVYITPWDLDMTYGYSGDSNSDSNMFENPENLPNVSNLWTNSKYVNERLITRYWDLRLQVFNMNNINKKIDSYYNKIKYSVARDSEKWLETDLEEETNKIRNWIEQRIEILDKEFRSK